MRVLKLIEQFQSYKFRIQIHVYKIVGSILYKILIRLENIFELIRDFPDTKDSLHDLKYCVDNSGYHDKLTSSIIKSLHERLLIIDAKTSVILSFYLLLHNCIGLLIDSDIHKESILKPVQLYLRSRKDTADQILLKILDQENMDDQQLQDGEIKLLLEIFPTFSVFAKSYRQLLANNLLARLDFECDDNVRHVEILKQELGEQEMLLSEIMMKDFADSRRITNSFQTRQTSDSQFSALVISKHYWPKLDDSKLKLPFDIKESMNVFMDTFESLYDSRELVWLPKSGLVDLVIQLHNNEPQNFQVTPLQASIIYELQKNNGIKFLIRRSEY